MQAGLRKTAAWNYGSRNLLSQGQAAQQPDCCMRKILYLDMDNVLVDFPSAFPRIASSPLSGKKSITPEVVVNQQFLAQVAASGTSWRQAKTCCLIISASRLRPIKTN